MVNKAVIVNANVEKVVMDKNIRKIVVKKWWAHSEIERNHQVVAVLKINRCMKLNI